MKTILLTMAAAATLMAAAPAMAQPYGGNGYNNGGGYNQGGYDRGDRGDHGDRGDRGGYDRNDSRQLAQRIERAAQRHQISYREAANLRAELRNAQQLENRYRRDGRLSGWERADLDRRFDRIAMQLRVDRHDRDYGSGYGGGYRR